MNMSDSISPDKRWTALRTHCPLAWEWWSDICICIKYYKIICRQTTHPCTNPLVKKKHPSLTGRVLLKQRRMIGCHFVTQGSRCGNSQHELVGTRRIWMCLPLLQWKRSIPKLSYVKTISICVLFIRNAYHREETSSPSGKFLQSSKYNT